MKQNWWKLAVVIVLVAAVGVVIAGKNRDSGRTIDKQATKETAKKLPKMIDLGANKCVSCKMMKPVIAELQKDYKGRLDVVFIDVWKDTAAARKYKIETIPTQILYDESGKEFYRHSGFFSKEDILKKFKEQGIKL